MQHPTAIQARGRCYKTVGDFRTPRPGETYISYLVTFRGESFRTGHVSACTVSKKRSDTRREILVPCSYEEFINITSDKTSNKTLKGPNVMCTNNSAPLTAEATFFLGELDTAYNAAYSRLSKAEQEAKGSINDRRRGVTKGVGFDVTSYDTEELISLLDKQIKDGLFDAKWKPLILEVHGAYTALGAELAKVGEALATCRTSISGIKDDYRRQIVAADTPANMLKAFTAATKAFDAVVLK